MSEPVDHCGCSKPRGCWGMAGWHFRKIDETLLAAWEIESFVKANQRQPTPEERHQCLLRAPIAGKQYLGTDYGYEPCPAYQAKLAARQPRNDKRGRRAPNLDRFTDD